MSLELKGKVVKVLPLESGEGKNGTWKRQSFVINVPGEYPKDVCFQVFGEKVQLLNMLAEGQVVKVHFDASSREFNNKYYTNLTVWKIEPQEVATTPNAATKQEAAEEEDDLPF